MDLGLISASVLARKCGVSRQLIYSYVEKELLEPYGTQSEMVFGEIDVRIVSTIQRLKGPPYNLKLKVLRQEVWPKLSWEAVASLSDANDASVQKVLQDAGISLVKAAG